MWRTFDIPISWGELLKRTWNEFMADNCLGLAAQLAYHLLLALVPALVFLLALTSYFPPHLIDQMINSVGTFTPSEMTQLVRDQMNSIVQGQHGGLLTFGFLMALWSSSAAVVAITDALNRAYDIDEGRPWWKVRLSAIALTIGLAVFVLVAFAWSSLVQRSPRWLASPDAISAPCSNGRGRFSSGRWCLPWSLTALALLNYFGPGRGAGLGMDHAGAVLATVLWLVASLASSSTSPTSATTTDLRIAWRHHHPDALVLPLGARDSRRRRDERGDRTCVAVRQGSGREGARGEEEAWSESRAGLLREAGKRGQTRGPAGRPRPFNPQPVHAESGRKLFPGIPVFLAAWWLRRRSTRE